MSLWNRPPASADLALQVVFVAADLVVFVVAAICVAVVPVADLVRARAVAASTAVGAALSTSGRLTILRRACSRLAASIVRPN
jgi:hypothetical protein